MKISHTLLAGEFYDPPNFLKHALLNGVMISPLTAHFVSTSTFLKI